MTANVYLASTLGSALVLVAGVAGSRGQDTSAVIGVEKAGQPGGPWVKVPVSQIPLTADGRMVDPSSSSSGFYRLQIEHRPERRRAGESKVLSSSNGKVGAR
ncbi:MAG TPA: hypothetical protein VJA21_06665 [Verrucomicrobiae bacterium]